MSDIKLTPEQEAQIAQAIRENKPYLLAVEDAVQSVQHGEIDIKIFVRNGSVDKIMFYESKSWIRQHIVDPKDNK
jgi:hypothetical protein